MMKCLLWYLLARARSRMTCSAATLPHIHYHAISRGVERVFYYFPASASSTTTMATPASS